MTRECRPDANRERSHMRTPGFVKLVTSVMSPQAFPSSRQPRSQRGPLPQPSKPFRPSIRPQLCAYQRNNDAEALRQRLATATGQLSALQTQAKTEQQELSATQQQLSASEQQASAEQRQLQAESRPDLPIKLSFRRALTSQGSP
jgi:hypothetical protein